MLRPMLCGWYSYMAVLALLMALSAGPRSTAGRWSILAALLAVGLNVLLWRPLGRSWPATLPGGAQVDLARFAPDSLVFLIALGMVVFHRRQDTRLIALLLAGSSLLPLFLTIWQP